MNPHSKNFIEEIRSLSDPVKRKILFGATAIMMVLVVYLWLAYFNTLVPSAVPITIEQAPVATTSTPEASGSGIFGLFADAAGSFWQAIRNGVRGFAGALKNPRQYNVSPR